MTIDKAKLRAFAERLVSEHQGGNGDPVPAIGVPAADVLALLAEIDHLTESRRVAREDRNRIGDRHDANEIERDQLKAENSRLRTDIESWRLTVEAERNINRVTGDELERLKGPGFNAELAALRKDAERYRWLRQASATDGEYTHGVCIDLWENGCGFEVTLEEADAAVDTAMAKEAPHG